MHSDIALHGQSAMEVMKRLALSIADAALEAALLGTGPLAGLFGDQHTEGGGFLGSLIEDIGPIFGGPRASGGPVSPGKFYAVNERSTAPSLFIPLGPGRIEAPGNDNSSQRGGGSPVIQNFDMRGAIVQQDMMRQIERIADSRARAAVQGYDRIVGARVNEWNERGG